MYAHCTHATNPTFVHARGCPPSYPRNPTLRAKQLKTSIRTPVFSGAGGSANRSEGASSQRRGYQGQPRCRVCAIFKQWIGSGIGRSCSALKEEQTPAHNNGRVQEGRGGLASEQEPCFGNVQRFTLVNCWGHFNTSAISATSWYAAFAIHGWSNTAQPTLGKRIEQNCRPSALQSQHLKMKRLMTTTSAWTYASARSHPHRIILVITSILRAAHRFLWNCTCCALLVQGKYSCACPHKTTPYSKCEWICSVRDKHCCAK